MESSTKMSSGELDCIYAILILHDDGIPITAEKIGTLLKASNVTIESYWPSLFAKLAQSKNVDDLVLNSKHTYDLHAYQGYPSLNISQASQMDNSITPFSQCCINAFVAVELFFSRILKYPHPRVS